MSQNNIWGDLLQSIAPEQNIRDYQHAARTFVDGLYRLSPKLSNLYHVFIDLNQNIAGTDQNSLIEMGLMAKSVNLPKFNVQNKVYNAYNRKMVQQERVNYDPVNITFHDDSADIVSMFWQNYFSYYYRDSDYLGNESTYTYDSKYKQRQQQLWGYSPTVDDKNQPYINAIRIYSLHQKRFSAYYLVKPMITSFAHGQHSAGEYTPLEHQMTVAYESVLYESGPVEAGTVMGFDQIHYDNTPSPLRNAGAAIGSVKGIIKGIENGDLGSIINGGINAVNILTGTNIQLKQAPALDLSKIGNSILKGQNPFSTVFAPTSSSVQQGIKRASGGGGLINR